MQSGIEIYTPARTPTCCPVTFQFKCSGCSTMDGFLRVHTIVNVMSWINAKEMALVAMVRVFIFPIVEPFLQIAFLSYLVGL